MGRYDDSDRSLGCVRITLLIVFTVFQLAAIGLGIAAVVVPSWLNPDGRLIPVADGDQVKLIDNAGLWQICEYSGSLDANATSDAIESFDNIRDQIENSRDSFTQIGSEDCNTGSIVEDFYKSGNAAFSEDMYTEFIATRAMAILFVIFAITKLVSLLNSKCCNTWCSYVVALVAAIIEAGGAAGALLAYGLILQEAVDTENQGASIRDFWGLAYQMFLAAGAIAVVANIGFCF